MIHIELMRADPADAVELADISNRSFHSDVQCGGKGEGGPPGYDSPEWQARIMGKSHYYKVLLDGKMIGGAIIFPKGGVDCHLGRIFIDPAHHRKGIGTEVIRRIIAEYPLVKKWSLETPPWNTRTREFYLKQGFRIAVESKEDLFFEKSIK
jgi:ribosomal protein S18 acetylase RimI-like enzyme